MQNSSEDEIFGHVMLLLKIHLLECFAFDAYLHVSHNVKEIESTRSLIQESSLLGTHAMVVQCDLPWYEENLRNFVCMEVLSKLFCVSKKTRCCPTGIETLLGELSSKKNQTQTTYFMIQRR